MQKTADTIQNFSFYFFPFKKPFLFFYTEIISIKLKIYLKLKWTYMPYMVRNINHISSFKKWYVILQSYYSKNKTKMVYIIR